jgi:hypothetical protein
MITPNLQQAEYAIRPFDGLFGKSEDQRKQEIYAVVDAYTTGLMKNDSSLWPLSLSETELTNMIYEERLANIGEYSKPLIEEASFT